MKQSIPFGFILSLTSVPAFSQTEGVLCSAFEASSRPSISKALRSTCKLGSAEVELLAFEGSFENTAFEHGKMLAQKIDDGLAGHVKRSKEKLFESKKPLERAVYKVLLGCMEDKLKKSVSLEFINMHNQLASGMLAGGVSTYNAADLTSMSLSSEVSIAVSGLQRKLKANPYSAVAELWKICAPLKKYTFAQTQFFASTFVQEFLHSGTSLKIGCTGADASGDLVDGNSLIMARNLDTSALDATKNTHVLAMHSGGKYKYVGAAAAGMHYTGGISGFNEKGIGVHLHQQETEDFELFAPSRSGNTAFFLQNKILENATSLEDAIQILEGSSHFGAWTFVVADSKTKEIASFEVAGRNKKLARHVENGTLAQSNHFLHSEMKNKYYNYSYNKTLESRFRFERVNSLFARAKQDIENNSAPQLGVQFFVNLLADHQDKHMGWRSFGRNITKTYTALSHIMQPEEGLFTLTMGNALPVTEGNFATFKVNWNYAAENLQPFVLVNEWQHQNTLTNAFPQWKKSLNTFVQTYLNWSKGSESEELINNTLSTLKNAGLEARFAGRPEYSYEYLRARLTLLKSAKLFQKQLTQTPPSLKTGENLRSAMEEALELYANLKSYDNFILPYDRALLQLWTARALQLNDVVNNAVSPNIEIASLLMSSKSILEVLIAEEKYSHKGINNLLTTFFDSKTNSFLPFLPMNIVSSKIDFVTVE